MLCFTIQISLIWCMPFPQKINLHWLRPYLLFTLILMYKENPDNIILLYPLGNSFRFLFLLIMWCLFYINFKITLNILLISFYLLIFSNWNTFFNTVSSNSYFVMNNKSKLLPKLIRKVTWNTHLYKQNLWNSNRHDNRPFM